LRSLDHASLKDRAEFEHLLRELFIAANAEFFSPGVTGWGMPGGVTPKYVSPLDVPLVRDHPAKEKGEA